MAIAPASAHAPSARAGDSVSAATREGLKKMPTPMIAPMTMQVAEKGPNTRCGVSAPPVCDGSVMR